MKNSILLFGFITLLLASCIQDDIINDFVKPELRLVSTPDTLLLGSQFQFEVMYFNSIGIREDINPAWSSSDETILSITNTGLASALQKGNALITISYTTDEIDVKRVLPIVVGEVTSIINETEGKSGIIATTSSYKLQGEFTVTEMDNNLIIDIAENYEASSALPGLFIYLANNTNSVAGALEIGPVEVFEGAHQYEVEGVGINEYSHLLYFCKPFNVKVGDGEIK